MFSSSEYKHYQNELFTSSTKITLFEMTTEKED